MDSKSEASWPRTLLAGIGYSNLRDHSVGPVLADRLASRAWPQGVDVEDFSFGAIDAVHRLREAGYARAVFYGAAVRGAVPGTIRHYLWTGGHDPKTVQERVAEAAQAVISLEHTLIVASHFRALPEPTWVYEVEPQDEGFGDGFSPAVERAVDELEQMLRAEVGSDA
ncbi:MAG: hydrogenase maturation protease [Candidatus Dormibacteria bacterium]